MRDLIALDDASKVWIYQSSRTFSPEEVASVKNEIFHFVQQWTSHNQALMAYGNVFHYRYVALFVDETQSHASGCSIDSSVHFIKHLENKYQTNFFDRMNFTYMKDEVVYDLPSTQMKEAYTSGQINEETLFFNNLVKNKGEFLTSWIIPLRESWHARFVK